MAGFSPQVDRILAKHVTKKNEVYYLVKWLSQSYGESTWELEKDIKDDVKIQRFEEIQTPPSSAPPSPASVKKTQWVSSKESKEYLFSKKTNF